MACSTTAPFRCTASRSLFTPVFNSAQNRHSRHVQTRRELHIEHQKQLQGQIYPGHIPLNWFQTALMTVGSAFMSLADPRRGDMIAALGEITAGPSLPRLRDAMLESDEGRRILRERPRVTTSSVDMSKLAQYPEGTFGRAYVTWLERCGVTPDTREPVHYISDPELAYVMQRYRECHDFYHCITNMPVSVEYELALKYFEFANLGLPMTALSALFGPLRLTSERRHILYKDYVPWALKCGGSARCLITVYWEERWNQDVEEMRNELGIWNAPPAKWRKPLNEAKKAARQREREPDLTALRAAAKGPAPANQ